MTLSRIGARPARHPGLEVAAVRAWLLGGALRDAEPPLVFSLLPGGRSNLTYRVEDGSGRRWVLRRPPLGPLPPRAHEIEREYGILRELHAAGLPVPRPLALCRDVAVTGAPFSLLEHVDGTVVNSRAVALRLDEDARRRAGLSLVRTLARVHAADVGELLIGPRAESYAARQLRRWRGQWEAIRTRAVPLIDHVAERLSAGIPPEREVTLVHGAFRLDNVVVDARGEVKTVLDWELCTVGDPLADLGLLLTFWPQQDDPVVVGDEPLTRLPGFPTREELVETYATATGRDLAALPFYRALGAWKAAILVQAAHHRGGTQNRTMEKWVNQLAALAEEAAWRAGL